MSLGDDVFRVHLTHHPSLSMKNLHFVIHSHIFCDKMDNLFVVTDIHTKFVSPILGRGGEQDVLVEGNMTPDHTKPIRNSSDRHILVLFLHSKRDSRLRWRF